jgi:diguanylate cyclase (GGDEF)-like protein
MLRFLWPRLAGPFITLAAAVAMLALDRSLLRIPNADVLLILAVVFAAYRGGIGAGLTSAAIAFAAVALLQAGNGGFGADQVARLVVTAFATLAAAVAVGLMRARERRRAFAREQRAGAEIEHTAAQLLALRATLDDLDYGVVVLDRERRARFVNRAFRRIWRVADEFADNSPGFLKLMYHGCGADDYAVAHERLGAYVEEQMALIRTGEDRALDIRLADGEVMQFRCKALPGGRRLLTYGNVSGLVRRADMFERLASVDGMTGLYNRRHFLALAEAEWARFRRYGRAPALLMIDIDRFKSINDGYGHDVGDRVIKEVAGLLRTTMRATDTLGRVGGEEFAAMLPEATLDSACNAGERLRATVAERVVTANGERLPVTVSIGAVLAEPQMRGVEDLMKGADIALYEAKNSGRNRVCRYAPSTDPVPDEPAAPRARQAS